MSGSVVTLHDGYACEKSLATGRKIYYPVIGKVAQFEHPFRTASKAIAARDGILAARQYNGGGAK